MIVKKVWIQQSPFGTFEWRMEGWYLFGCILLYKHDVQPRGRFGRTLFP
jgi:hypothetical protein